MNILDEIVEHKKEEVANRKREKNVAGLESLPLFLQPAYSLKRSLLQNESSGIIAEFKRKSPSKGFINARASVSKVTESYSRNGAAGLSILTDENFFGGSLDDMITARINELPILRKDFIIDEYQVVETKAYGADVILLIASILTPSQVNDLASTAHALGLEVILEVHDEKEMEMVNERIDIVGINNRDLKTFKVSLGNSVELGRKVPAGKLRISESGIQTAGDIHYLKQFGFNGFLIGENFMKTADPGLAFMKFITEINETGHEG